MSGLRDRVLAVLAELRPFLHADGGDVELVDLDERTGTVRLHLVGACGSCPSATNTVEHGIKVRLQEAVPEVREVVAV